MRGERINLMLLLPALMLLGLGVVMVYSASAVFADTRLGDSVHFLSRQAVFAGLGVVVPRFEPPMAWLAFLPIPIIVLGSFRFQRRNPGLRARYVLIAPRDLALHFNVDVSRGDERKCARLEMNTCSAEIN